MDIGGSGAAAPADAGGGLLPAEPAPAPDTRAEADGDGDGDGDGGESIGAPATTLDPAEQALGEKRAAQSAAVDEASSLDDVREAVEQAAMAFGIGDSLNLTLDARGLVVTIVTDEVLFESGSADLQGAGLSVLDVVGHALQAVPNDILVEGHTDNRPISNGRFADNWDLSNARATSVVRYFMERDGIAPERLTPSGRADTQPLADNATPEGAAKNRRVEVIVRAEVSLEPVLGDDGQVHTDEDGEIVVPEAPAETAAPVVVSPEVVPHVEPDIQPGEPAGAGE